MQVLQSNKANFNESRLIEVPAPTLSDGQVKLRIERFSFTANNITYAVLGDYLKYWSFFPALNTDGTDASAEWGQIPVWGFASVIESNSDEVGTGERFFGYFPPAQECVMTPANVANGTFIDGSPHRAHLPAGYNIYRRAESIEPGSDFQADNERCILYPLFVTAYCIHDMLAEQGWHDAEQVFVLSASSKTSIGVAYAMQADDSAPASVGLTSAKNKAMVNDIGLYDSVNSYDDIGALDANTSSLIIDMSGNKAILSELHQHLGDNMKFTLSVGITHWAGINDQVEGINSARSEQFFAPGHIQEMIKRDGPKGFQDKSGQFIAQSALKTRDWLQCKELDGLGQLAPLYSKVCRGDIDANTGLLVVMS